MTLLGEASPQAEPQKRRMPWLPASIQGKKSSMSLICGFLSLVVDLSRSGGEHGLLHI